MESPVAKRILEREAHLRSARSPWESTWQEILDYIVPRKAEVTTRSSPGEKQDPGIYDSTAIQANELLAGALHGMLTNPTAKWFELTTGDEEADNDDENRKWLQGETDAIHDTLNNSNFQTEVHEVYLDLGSIGTSCFFCEDDKDTVVRFSTRPIAEYCVDEDNKGRIDTVYRLFKWKPRQIVQQFGLENVGEHVRKLYEKGSDDLLEVVHAVEPRADAVVDGLNPKTFAYGSYYVLKEKAFVLKESGFRELPFAVPRWTKTSGEVWGRSPGFKMLADIKMVNEMMRTTLEGAHKAIRPPIWIEDDGVMGQVRLTPGGVTIGRAGAQPPQPIITDPRVDFGYQAVEDVRKRIRSGFYVDQLQLNEGPQMTATEVMRRTEDQLRLMGPVLGRQHHEFLKPVVERVYSIRLKRGLVAQAPDKLRNKVIGVKYSSMIARSQRMNEGQNFLRAAAAVMPLFQIEPAAAKIIDAMKGVKYIFNLHGVPQSVLRTQDEVEQIMAAEAQAQREALKQQQEAHEAEQVSKVGAVAVQAQQAGAQ